MSRGRAGRARAVDPQRLRQPGALWESTGGSSPASPSCVRELGALGEHGRFIPSVSALYP